MVAADTLLIRPDLRLAWGSLMDMGVECEVYGDVGAPAPGYVTTYNQEMEREIERHYDQDTLHAVRQLL